MKRFAVVDAITGAIGNVGNCADDDVAHQAGAGKLAVELAADAPRIDGANYRYDIATGQFIQTVSDLDHAKIAKSNALSGYCAKQITAGFSSSAMGTEYFYPSAATDQANLQQTSLTGGLLATQNEDGTWGLTAHTSEEATSVLTDFIGTRDGARSTLLDLRAQVDAATTIEEVEAIQWDGGVIVAGGRGGSVNSAGGGSRASL